VVSTVVVTGSAGMLGSHLVERLRSAGVAIRGVDLRPVPDRPGLVHHVGDIRDRSVLAAAMAGADAVVHCAAALPSYPEDQIRPIIVDGTAAVLATAAAAGVGRVVHVSSTAVYGLPKVVPTTEEHPREPVDAYSRAKAEAEVLAERARSEGRLVTVLRPKTFLGPGRMGLFAMLFEWAEEGRHFPVLGRGDVRIQMLALDDLLDGVQLALGAGPDAANDTYNLAATEFGTLREDFQAVLDAAGHGRRIIGVPAAPALLVLDVLRRLRLSPVYGRLLHKLRNDSYVSTRKAADRLGFRPRLSNQDAIVATYRWWQENRPTSAAGATSTAPWKQGVLSLARHAF
jgi:2-alkyl-3-oxoalkanoate reductase